MLLRVVNAHNVFNLNIAIPVLIKLLEGLQDESHPVLAHLAPDLSDELFIIDAAIAVKIKEGEKVTDVLRAHICLEVPASFLELCAVQGP